MKQKLIPSSINQYMVGFAHSLHIQSNLNPKKKVYPFSGGGVFFVPDCIFNNVLKCCLIWIKLEGINQMSEGVSK